MTSGWSLLAARLAATLAALLAALLVTLPIAAFADNGPDSGPDPTLDQAGVLRLAESGQDTMTLAELRRRCQRAPAALAEPAAPAEPKDPGDVGAQVSGPVQPGVMEARMDSDRRSATRPFSVIAHRPNYFLYWTIRGVTNSVNTVGFVHQSNGRSGQLSRTWDRLFAMVVFERAHWALALKP